MFRNFALAWTLAAAALAASAQPAPPAPPATAAVPFSLEEYFRLPQFSSPQLSPNGKYLAVTIPIKGRLNLAVVDLDSRKAQALTSDDEFDVLEPRWVGNDKITFTLGRRNAPTGAGQFEGGGFFVVARDGSALRKVFGTVKEARGKGQAVYRSVNWGRRVPGSTDEILVTGNLRTAEGDDIYRLNLNTGRTTLVTTDRPAYAQSYLVDHNLEPRIVTAWIKDTLTFVTYWREQPGGPWKELFRRERTGKDVIVPLSILADNTTMLVASNIGRDTMAVYRYDPRTRKLGELLAEHPVFDIGASADGERIKGLIINSLTDVIEGVQVEADKPITVWFDARDRATQATVDAALPGKVNDFTRFPDSSRLLVTSYSDVSPPRWYILDEGKRTLEELFSQREWLDGGKLVAQRPFMLKTRDGLQIPGYYFLPKDHKPGQRLPTVVHVHGGPHARADFYARGFGYSEAQLLASRGYAVVVPNHRITPGFGARIYNAGFGTIGRQMSEDHEDAALWAVEQGFADRDRICISGASYGGYASLRAVAKTPELFKCAVSGLMVSDLDMQLHSTNGDTHSNKAGVQFWYGIIGHSDKDRTAIKTYSPVNMADKIKAPVFVYAGTDDIRTPLEQTTAMTRALAAAGNPAKVVIMKKDEGHGFGKTENNIDLYQQMLAFLDTYIGPRSRSAQ